MTLFWPHYNNSEVGRINSNIWFVGTMRLLLSNIFPVQCVLCLSAYVVLPLIWVLLRRSVWPMDYIDIVTWCTVWSWKFNSHCDDVTLRCHPLTKSKTDERPIEGHDQISPFTISTISSTQTLLVKHPFFSLKTRWHLPNYPCGGFLT